MSYGNIIIEGYCLLITISLQICNYLSNKRRVMTRSSRIMCTMIFTNALIIIFYITTVIINGNVQYSVLNNILTGCCYSTGAVLTELFGEYVLAFISEKEKISKYWLYALRTVCGIAIALDLISIFNGMYFSTIDGFHVRGPYYMFNQVLALCILLGELIFILAKIKVLGKAISALAMYGFFPAVSVALQIFVQDYVLLYPATTLSLLIIYLVSYINQTDQLHEKNLALETAMEAAQEAKKEADKANSSKSEFLSSMSHDIRTPLNAIVGMTDMAVENIGDQKQALEYLGVVQSSSKHLLSLVNDVLDLSMIESGKIVIAESEFILPDLIIEVERMTWPLTKAKNQEFILNADHLSDEYYIGDMPRIRQILVNFISNAVKYTPSEGKIALTISEETDAEGTQLRMSVEDNGIGIDKKSQAHIFEPFVREVKSTVNPVEGTGLGLAIVHNIVEAMHGTVSVISEKGVGSTFTAVIPIKIGDQQKMLKKFEDVANYHVLFIADSSEVCTYVKKSYREQFGNECDVAESGAVLQGTYVSQGSYDAIISISETNVVDVIKKLRALYPGTDIVYGCNMKMLDYEKGILDAGADSVLYRPVFRSTLYEEYQALKLKKSSSVGTDRYLTGKNILVVEDQSINYLIIEHILTNAGAIVMQAENGLEAVDKFMASSIGHYDLIMMDIMMPVMDGYTATAKIRNASRADAKTVPIVAMTANAFAEDVQKSKEAGMNAHISKPIEPQTVKDILIRIFSQGQN